MNLEQNACNFFYSRPQHVATIECDIDISILSKIKQEIPKIIHYGLSTGISVTWTRNLSIELIHYLQKNIHRSNWCMLFLWKSFPIWLLSQKSYTALFLRHIVYDRLLCSIAHSQQCADWSRIFAAIWQQSISTH